MARIERHPDVADYILEMSRAEITARGGVADLVESGHVILIKDYRLPFDFAALDGLVRNLDAVEDQSLRRHVKKLQTGSFFDQPRPSLWGKKAFKDPLRQTLFETICGGSRRRFERVSKAIHSAHEAALEIFAEAFPGYETYRLVPGIRLTRTLFENLHWDDHSIDDDFHQARVFANLDTRPRIWHLSHRFPDLMRQIYREHDLARFAGKDPNMMLSYIGKELLGGMHRQWKDTLPRHKIAFDPGEVWLGESRLVSHQIYYGEAALVYMWFVRTASMADPQNRFNAVVERIHAEMRASATADVSTSGAI